VARADVQAAGPVRYRVRAGARIGRLEALVPDLPGDATATLVLRGRGTDPQTREAALDATVDGATVRGVRIERAAVAARLAGRRVTLSRATVEGPGLRAEVRGGVDADGAAADLTAIAAAELATLAPALDATMRGLVTVRAEATGPLASLAVSATADGEALALGAAAAERARVRATLRELGGAAPGGDAEVSLVRPALGGDAAQTLGARLAWRTAAGETRAELRTLVLDTAHGSWRLAQPAELTLAGGAVATPGIALVSGAQRLAAAGRVAWGDAESDAQVSLTGVDLAPLCALADTRPCGGTLDLRGTVGGTAAAPRLTATLRADAVRLDDVAYGTVTADARYAPRAVSLDAALRHPAAGELRLRGDVPVDLAWAGARRDVSGEPVALTLEAERLDLRFVRGLAPAQLRASEGRLTLALRITGPRAAPRAFGDVTLRGGRVELAATGVAYHNVRLTAVADGDRVEVRELRARTGDGILEGSGTIGLADARAAGVGVRIALKDFVAVRRPAYEATVSGALDLAGTIARPELTGALEIDHGVVRPAHLPTSGPTLEPDPTITVVNAPPTAPAEPPPPPPPLLDELRLAVTVELGDDVSVRRTDAHIRLGGRVEITREPFGPVLVRGRIQLLRGWYAFQGRRFEVRQGTVLFAGESPPRPTFDVTAEHRAGEYTIQVRIEGPIDRPHLTLSSDPPLEEADILAVLLFGKPSQDLGRGEGVRLQENALALASGYVMPELQASVMETLGLSSLEVALPEGTEPGRVGVGRYVTSDLFISVAQEFGARAAEVVSVEYGLTPRISIRGTTSTRGTGGVDVFWSRRY
jgi:translocation and assembly module TamB